MNRRVYSLLAACLSFSFAASCTNNRAAGTQPSIAGGKGADASPALATGSTIEDLKIAPPVIPDRTFNLKDFGAVGDGKTFNTDAFNKAVQAIQKAGGGHLIVPHGTYLTQAFSLTSHMDLHLDAGSVIKAPATYADYGLPTPGQILDELVAGTDTGGFGRIGRGPAGGGGPGGGRGGGGRGGRGTTRATQGRGGAGGAPATQQTGAGNAPVAGATGAEGFSGTAGRGRGTFISGYNVTDVSITGSGTIDGSGQMFWYFASGDAGRFLPFTISYSRPVLVSVRGDRLLFDGVNLINSPMFHLTPSGHDIMISNLHIVAAGDSPNTDAMDLRGQRIVVRNCEINVGDDNIEIGGPCHDLLVENIKCLHGHGISIGSPTAGGVGNVMVRHCTFDGGENAIRIKSARGRGGEITGITYRDISITHITKRPIDIDMLYDNGPREPGQYDTYNIPYMHNVLLKDITITHSPISGRIVGLIEEPARDVTLQNLTAQTDEGMQIRDAVGITFKNVKMEVANGDAVMPDNATVNTVP